MNWINTVKREYPCLYFSLVYKGYSNKKLWKKYGINYCLKDLMQIDYNWIYPDYYMIDFAKWLSNKVLNDKRFFEKLRKKSLFYEKLIISASKKDFKSFVKAAEEFVITIALFFICDDIIEKHVQDKISGKLPEKETVRLMNLLTLPLEDNFNIKERLSALKNSYERHIKDFIWMHSRYGKIVPYTKRFYVSLKKELEEQNYLDRYRTQKKEIKSAIRKAKGLLGKDKHIIDVIQFFVYFRTHRTDIMNKSLFLIKPIVEKEAKKYRLSYEDIMFLDIDEILHDKIPHMDIINQRKNGFSAVGRDGKIKYYTGAEHLEYVNKYLKADNNLQEVKGRPAFVGKIIGTARVISSNNDLGKIQHGDILITYMTTPNMVPAMQKAAAFVTDEGGITCHAAIVAREMKKPCIIGTKHATKIFRDGDLVEVDANKGIVKKVK